MSPGGDWPAALLLADEAATARFGAGLAAIFRPGDVVALSGELGAGKTTLARAIIRAIAGRNIEVPSPTFTLVQEYRDLAVPVVHYDLYRLRDPAELTEIGFGETDRDGVALVEWPERAAGFLPEEALSVTLEMAKDGRRATLNGSHRWKERLATVP